MTWAAFSASRRGGRHVRDDRPNQDAHRTLTGEYGAVIAAADGHGHPSHPRSGIGALRAVETITALLEALLPELRDVTAAEALVRDEVGPALVAGWRTGVEEHAEAEPFAEQEAPRSPEETWLRYGTTVLAAAANDSVVVLAQIGDGDVVVVSDTGEVWQPLPEDELLDGVRTTSLCQPDPLESLRVVALPAGQVRLVYACTDGFGKPQLHDQWWRQVGIELTERTAEHGADWLAERLPGWLIEPAEVGGDDTTMAVLVAIS